MENVYEIRLAMPATELAQHLGCKPQELDEREDEELWALIRDYGAVVGCEEKVAATLEP